MKYVIPLLLLFLFSACDNALEGEAKQESNVNGFVVYHSNDVDSMDLERLDRWFWELCNEYGAGTICTKMQKQQTTRIFLGGCADIFNVNLTKFNLGGMTISRSEGNEWGAGQDIYVCMFTRNYVREEFSHGILNEYQRSYLGISRQIHEACAKTMAKTSGTNFVTWDKLHAE